MKVIPKCLNHRYKLVDELISELDDRSRGGSDCSKEIGDAGVKLMCRFWNILKENPDCNLDQAVKEKMGLLTTGFRPPRRVTCYVCAKKDDEPYKGGCNHNASTPVNSKAGQHKCHATGSESGAYPLSTALGNLKEAESFDKNCAVKVKDLEGQQKTLEGQIRVLEQREKDGVILLKKAECMWTCLEDSYRQKVADSEETHKLLLKQLMEVENSTSKWRKNKKDLELQVLDVDKIHRDIKDKINIKNNDLKLLENEKKALSQRAQSSKAEVERAKALLEKKKQALQTKETNAKEKIAELEKDIKEQKKLKLEKEKEGSQCIREARDELQKLSRALVQKKVENSVLLAQKDEMLADCEMYKNTYDECRNNCQSKKERLNAEIKNIDKEIANFKVKCLRCHECTDTVDLRKMCSDCPRCLKERDCLLHEEYCEPDPSMDCVCMKVKMKLMDNVLENMYTVLERKSSSKSGKVVADAILNSLNRSVNGKLDRDARKMVRDFVLTTVQKNLNLTVIGGAVKTRCEMDSDTYTQLMYCLNDVKVTKPPREDKQTASRKGPCRRWGGSHDCNCPSGPNDCVCGRKAPPAPKDRKASLPEPDDEEVVIRNICPQSDREEPCGPDCAQHNIPGGVGAEVSSWRSKPCAMPSLTFPKNVKAAQCVIGADGYDNLIDKRRSTQLTNRILHIDQERAMHCNCTTSPCICSTSTLQVKVMQNECDKRTSTFKNFTPQNASKVMLDKAFSTAVHKSEWNTKYPTNNRFVKREQLKYAPKIIKHNTPFDVRKNKNKDPLLVAVPERHTPDSKSTKPTDKSTVYPFEEIQVTKTSSGSLSVMLDDNLILNLEKVINDGREVFASLHESISGRFLLSIQAEPTNKDKRLVNLIKTPSGTTFLKLDKPGYDDKNIANKVDIQCCKDVICKSIQYSSSDWDQSLFLDESVRTETFLLESENYNQIELKRVGIQYSSSDLIQSKLLDVSNQKKQHVNESEKDIDLNERDISIQKSSSDQDQLVHSSAKEETCKKLVDTEKYFNLKRVKGVGLNLINLPVVLKSKTTGSYTIVLDKEFEKYYKKTIQSYIKNNYQSVISVTITDSQNCEIDLKPDCNKQNALLVKTQSGNVKILVIDSSIENLNTIAKADSSRFESLLSLLGSSHKISNTNHKNTSFAKSISDSYISEKSRARINEDLSFDLVSLRKTPSGHYAAVLARECKKELLNSIRTYVSKKTADFIPVRKSQSGNVTILVDEHAQNEVKFTALKITASGNIILLIDDAAMLEKKPSLPVEQELSNTATKFLKEPEELDCTSAGRSSGSDTSEKNSPDENNYFASTNRCCKRNRPMRRCIAKLINQDKPNTNPEPTSTCICSDNCCSYEEKGKPPNTDYSPTRKCNEAKNDPVEHCFSVYDSVSRVYENKCDIISNEISEIFSEIYNSSLINSDIRPSNPQNAEFHNLVWDSDEVMPFQLPPFLKENPTDRKKEW